MNKQAERTLAKIAKLDTDISALSQRLDTKLSERRTLLAGLIADGESLRSDVADTVRNVLQAENLATTGRYFTEDQIREIRAMHKRGVSQSEIGRRFSLSQPSVYKIVHRQSYKDVA